MKPFLGRVGFVLLAGLVVLSPAQASAGDLTAAATQALVAAAAQEGRQATARDWQRQYDKALSRRGSGKSKMVLGAITLGGGIGLRQWAVKRCTPDFTNLESFDFGGCGSAAQLADVGTLAAWGGLGLIGWGTAQYISANGELRRLEDQRPDDAALRPSMPALRLTSVAPPVSYTVRW